MGINNEKVNDLVFFYGLFIGAMCGGRIGYMLFYGSDQLLNNPLSLFYVWQGGLSFHGGLIGVIISFLVFAKKNNLSFFRLMDGVALSMPIGLGLVRIGNFLNGELYGRETNGEWGFIFPTDPYGLLRHPSQLYESLGEGVLLCPHAARATVRVSPTARGARTMQPMSCADHTCYQRSMTPMTP